MANKVEGSRIVHREDEKNISFVCNVCQLSEMCHYFGKTPNFVKKQIRFLEDTFVIRDPFTPRVQGKANFLMMGGICYQCHEQVCQGCSLFYRHRYCKTCLKETQGEFPAEIQAKIKKM